MKKEHEKMMRDLQRLLETQNFQSEKELRNFMDGLIGKKIPEFPKGALSAKEQAEDLVFEAYELPLLQAKAKIEKALQLDSECIAAYEALGSMENSIEVAIVFYEKGIAIGRHLFGGKFLKENKGMFWGIHETRPFMRCLQRYAICLYELKKVKECVAILEEMIELNPNDNQGVRDQLSLYLIQLNEDKKFLKYAKQYEEDGMAFPLFNRALFTFKKEGETEHANQQLKKALQQNKFVVKMLLANKPPANIPDYYGLGDKNEATYYVSFAHHIWKNTEGALVWLKRQTK